MTFFSTKKTGLVIGGSGLIGGSLLHYFKSRAKDEITMLAPNSKKLTLRRPDDIRLYFETFKPDFIINCAIASIDSSPQLAYEINYTGAVFLAKAALELNIPYIHISSAATMPHGHNLAEEDQLPLQPDLSNYSKSKLMAELTLEHLRRTRGLDYTAIRLGIVYGTHDHKIQGFQRLFFSIVNRSMPVILTKKEAMHSYSNSGKLPLFVAHSLANRREFSGETYNFVDPDPVKLSTLILTIKSYLELNVPKEIYIPFPMAKFGMGLIAGVVRMVTRVGIEARMPAELMFLENFYKTQTLSACKLQGSSFADPEPDTTIFTKLPDLIEYYVTRWEQLNLIRSFNSECPDPRKKAEEFLRSPAELLQSIHAETDDPFLKQCPLNERANNLSQAKDDLYGL